MAVEGCHHGYPTDKQRAVIISMAVEGVTIARQREQSPHASGGNHHGYPAGIHSITHYIILCSHAIDQILLRSVVWLLAASNSATRP